MSKPASSHPRNGVPSILETGSMLKLVTDLVEEVPTRLGSYRVLERIGEGGMGVVYLAEQDPPLVRRVAVKLARNAVPGVQALARFESERRTLAVMNHPNIARVYDAGSGPDARPYFVMEYVAGETITEFCDSRRLGIASRLELFLHVCEGVQHAHLNAVIHRDLKPANILVTTEGGAPTPKIIDFGIAKALDEGVGTATGLTQLGQLVGTPEYMSPEQAALDGRPVDSRTDIYSLGVVLYELLVGGRPFERETGPGASFVDLCRRIREQEPERPSVKAARASVEDAGRRVELGPRALGRRLRGDLDAIVIKALAKDPRSRYASSSDMAADIERHLRHLPIHARPPGPLVRLQKTFRRHRAASVVVAALSTTLIGLAVLGSVQALRAERESARAETEARLGNEVRRFVLGVLDPHGALGSFEGETIVASRDRATLVRRIREQFADQPVLQSQLLLAAGNNPNLYNSGGLDTATLVESRDRIRSLLGPSSAEALAADESVARAMIWSPDRTSEGERLLLEALERRRRDGNVDAEFWRTTATLAAKYKYSQRHEQAAPLFEAAIAGLESQSGPDDRDVLSTKVGLSGSYLELGRYAETQTLLESSIDRIRRVFGERDYETEVALYNLACVYAHSGRTELALEYLGRSIALGWCYPGGPARDMQLLSLHGDPRFDALDREGRLNWRESWPGLLRDAKSSIRTGRLAEAERLLRELVAAAERVEGPGAGGSAATARLGLARCWIAMGRFDDADRLLLPSLAAARAERSFIGEREILEALAQCDIGRGRRESALARIAAAASLDHAVFDNVDRLYADAESHALRGRDDDALRSLARASELGFFDADRLEHDLAFVKLRGRTEFVAIEKAARRRAI